MTHQMKIHNILTDEITVRDFTQAELAQHAIDQAESEALIALLASKASDRSAAVAKLMALGLNSDDVAALGLA